MPFVLSYIQSFTEESLMRFLRMSVSIIAIITVSLMLLLGAVNMKKKVAPVIICKEEGTINVPTNVTDEELIKYVTANDAEDGDLSDRIIVERQMYFLEKGLTTVVFSVCDSDNNTTKLSKNVKFTDYHSPRIKLLNDLIIPVKNSIDFKNTVSVIDKYDGDMSNRVKIISTTYNNLSPGEYDINFKVTNSFSDTCDVTIKAIVTDEDYSTADIKLSKYMIYVDKGTEIDFKKYINGVNDYNRRGFSTSSVVIDSKEYNSEKSGVYNVYYSIKSGNDTVAKTVLVVVVEGEK